MRPIAFVTLLAACALLGTLMAREPAPSDALPKAERRAILEELLPAIQLGDLAAITRTGTAISGKLTPAQRPAADRLLADHKLPPLTDLVTDARLNLIELGLVRTASAIPPQESLLLLESLKGRIEKLLTEGNKHAAFAPRTPATLDEFEKLFWAIHVFNNQLESGVRFSNIGQELKTRAVKLKPKGKSDLVEPALNADWNQLKADVVALAERFAVRDRELRIARLTLADQVLTDGVDVGERLLAALAIDLDGETLPPLLKKDKTFPVEKLGELEETILHARTAAGRDLMQKSRWLFTGLHWWLRGRYGLGTAGGGLLKDEAALKSPSVMFGLLMPIQPPIPTPATSRERVPVFDRRHHYLWQFETRQLASDRSVETTTDSKFVTSAILSITTTTFFY